MVEKMSYNLLLKYYIGIFFALWIFSSFIFIDSILILYIPFVFSLFPLLFVFVYPRFFNKNSQANSFFFLNLLLFFWVVLSCLNSDLKLLSLQRVLINYIPIFSLIIIFYSINFDFNFFKTFFKKIKNFVLVCCVFSFFLLLFGSIVWDSEHGYLNYINQLPFIYQRIMGDYPIYRASAFFVNPNTFGLWLLIGLASLLCWVDDSFRKNISLFIIGVGFFLSFSRGALLAVFIFLFIYSFFLKKYKTLLFISIFSILGYLIIEISGFSSFVDLSNSRFSSSLNSRDIAWDMLLESIANNLLLGVGFGVSNEIVLNIDELGFSSHNLHLQFAAEIGLIGYILFLLVYLYPVFFSFYQIRKNNRVKENTFFFALLIAILCHQVFENTLFRSGFFTYFWFFISCIPFYINHDLKAKKGIK